MNAHQRRDGHCELCGREVMELTRHHLVPQEHGGTLLPIAMLCKACHRQIHALYTNEDLIHMELTSIAALTRNEAIQAYIRYIRKQPPEAQPKLKKSHRVRNR